MSKRTHYSDNESHVSDIPDLDQAYKLQEELIGKLERTVEYHYRTNKELREQISKLEQEHLNEKTQLNNQLQSLEKENMNYMNEIRIKSKRLIELEHEHQLLQNKYLLSDNEKEIMSTNYKEAVSKLEEKYNHSIQEISQLKESNNQLKLQLLEVSKEDNNNLSTEQKDHYISQITRLRAELSDYKRRYEKIQKETEQVSSSHLQDTEKIRSLEILLNDYKKKNYSISDATIQIHKYKNQIHSVEQLLKNMNIQIQEQESPIDCMIHHFKKMAESVFKQTQDHENAVTNSQHQDHMIQTQEETIKRLNNEILDYIRQIALNEKDINTYQSQIQFFKEEINTLQNIINQLFEKNHLSKSQNDTDQNLNSNENKMNEEELQSKSLLLEKRIEVLKKQNEENKKIAEKTNNDIINIYKSKYEQQQQYQNELENQIKALQKQILNYESQLSIEKSKYIYENLNPLNTKILHLISNPTSNYNNNKYNELQRENKLLKDFIKQTQDTLEEKNGLSSQENSSTSLLQNPLLIEENEHLKTEVEDLNKRIKRLKEIFGEQMKIFKNAVYRLTGYKIDMTQDQEPRFRIKNIYSDSEEDFLLFSLDNHGELSLLETDMCQKIDSSIFTYIATCNSIPAFLSALCLNLFEKQTIIS